MKKEYITSDIFDTAMITYLNYIILKIKKNPNYDPHPLIKAMVLALQAATEGDEGKTYSALSGDAKEGDKFPKELYMVFIKKEDGDFKLLGIEDLTIQEKIPVDIALVILNLSMKLDKYKTDNVPIEDAISILNDVVPHVEFKLFDKGEWPKAGFYLKQLIEENKIPIPNNERLINALKSVRLDMSWEECPQEVRQMIGAIWSQKTYPSGNIIVLTPSDNEVQKYKLIDIVKQVLIGRMSKFFKKPKPN